MPSFFDELKRRHVIKSALAYLVAAWLIVQVLSVLLATFKAPDWVMQAAIIALAVGFPIWIIINWVYDFSSTGLVKTPEKGIDEAAANRTNIRLNRFIVAALSLAVVLLVFNQVRLTSTSGLDGSGDVVIAVLPFENLSPEEENDWIGDGFMNDLYAQLTKVGSFKVIHPISTMRYKDANRDLPEIIEELGVSHLLFGNIRKTDDQMMVSAQLVDQNEHNLWNESYRDSADDIFDVQLKVAKASSIAIIGALSESQEMRLDGGQKILPEANFHLVQAIRLIEQSSSKELDSKGFFASREYFEKALEVQPDLEEALSGLSYVLAWRRETWSRADSLASRALEINPTSDMANAAKAIILAVHLKQYSEAIELLNAAIVTNPSSVFCYDYLARLHSNRELDFFEPQKAVYLMERAIDLNPLYLNLYKIYGEVLADAREYRKVDSVVQAYTGILDDNSIHRIIRSKLFATAMEKFETSHDFNDYIEVFSQAAVDYPENKGYLHCRISTFYDRMFNDEVSRWEHISKAWENRQKYIFPNDDQMATFMLPEEFFLTLLAREEFEEALRFSRSEEVERWFFGKRDLYEDWLNYTQFHYHLIQGEIDLASGFTEKRFVVDQKLMTHGRLDRTLCNELYLKAKRGEVEQVLSALATDSLNLPSLKVELFAVLNRPDSLYYYLDQLSETEARHVNSWRDIDPYRNEERYIAFRKKHHLKDITVDGLSATN